VALKVVVARLTGDNGEAAVLKRLASRPRDHPGASHIVQLHDYFHIQGPNGTHQVLVMDILLLSHKLRLRAPDFLKKQLRSVCHQLLLGLSHLHQEGIVHGGKHGSGSVQHYH
jgi:serine/threonine-protein kinase SRPK3